MGAGLYTRPPLAELAAMSKEELMVVSGFMVGHEEHGSVMFPGLTDVRGLDLDRIVVFGAGSLEVYPEASFPEHPPPGTALNKAATVSLRCRPIRGGGASGTPTPEQRAKMRRKMEKRSLRLGVTFMAYDSEEWVFRVRGFDSF
jgi:nuclear pore complex protein Nup98-Nup96